MPILYILCGLPGSGKSTWAKSDERMKHCKYVSRDEIRFSILKKGESYFAHEKEVYRAFVQRIANNLNEGYDTIADATHLNMFARRKLTQALDMRKCEYKIVYIVFDVNISVCIERNNNREGLANVPETVIRNMGRDFYAPTFDEDERIINIITINN